jgi:hypothetical protein
MSEPVEMRCFVKELVSNPIRLPSGRPVPWEDVGDDTGVLSTNDPSLITELENAARRQVGGIRLVTAAEMEDVKKKSTVEELHKLSLFKANNQYRGVRLAGDAAPVVEVKPLPAAKVSPAGQPIATPTELPIPTPKSKKRSELMKTGEELPLEGEEEK